MMLSDNKDPSEWRLPMASLELPAIIYKNSTTGGKQSNQSAAQAYCSAIRCMRVPVIVSPVFKTNGSVCSRAASLTSCNCCAVKQKVKTILPQSCYRFVASIPQKITLPKKNNNVDHFMIKSNLSLNIMFHQLLCSWT